MTTHNWKRKRDNTLLVAALENIGGVRKVVGGVKPGTFADLDAGLVRELQRRLGAVLQNKMMADIAADLTAYPDPDAELEIDPKYLEDLLRDYRTDYGDDL